GQDISTGAQGSMCGAGMGAKQTFVAQEHQGPRKTRKSRNVEPSLLGCTLAIRGKLGLQRSKLRSTGSPFAFFASFVDPIAAAPGRSQLAGERRIGRDDRQQAGIYIRER